MHDHHTPAGATAPGPARNVPSVGVLVALVVHLALAATFIVGVATQPTAGPADQLPGRRIEGLVLDGSGVATTTPVRLSNIPPPVKAIPYRPLDGAGDPPVLTTTTKAPAATTPTGTVAP
jgi:hypothetical protein